MADWTVDPPKEEEPPANNNMRDALSVLRGHARASDMGDSAMIYVDGALRQAKSKLRGLIESLEDDPDGVTDNDLLILDLQDVLGFLEGPDNG